MRACISPMHCLSVSMAQKGAGLGTIIGVEGAQALATQAGYSSCRRMEVGTDSQFFFVLEQ